MRPGLHRYELPLGRHRRPGRGWPPLVVALLMVAAGSFGVLAVFSAAPAGLPVRPIHPPSAGVPGVPVVPEDVGSEPSVGPGAGQGQRGDDEASRSTPRPESTGLADPPLAPAAGNEPEPAPSPLSLPAPTSPPPMAVPSPSPSPSGPGCGRKPPHPTRSPKAQIVSGSVLH